MYSCRVEGFGVWLRQRRTSAGLSQDQLAEASWLSVRTIRYLENDRTERPRATTLRRLFDALEVPPDDRLSLVQGYDARGNTDTAPSDAQTLVGSTEVASGKELAVALKLLRASSGLSQRALAKRAGLHPRTISDLERGLRLTMRPSTATQIADAVALAGDEREHFIHLASHGPSPMPPIPSAERLPGRSNEIAELQTRLKHHQLVLIVGPGGVGKTTLALTVAPTIDRGFRLIELADQAPGKSLDAAIADSLTIDQATVPELAKSLHAASLIVVDNVEHLAAVGPTLDALAEALPDVTLLVTSRVPIRTNQADQANLAIEPLEAITALKLLQRLALEAGGGTAWSQSGPYGEICDKIDRLPLAIELAAAWAPLFSPTELLQRLDHPLTLLKRPGSVHHRHDSIRTVVDWTLRLLPISTRRLFVELTTHPAAFSLEMVEHIHTDNDDVLRAMHDLVNAGLITVMETQTPARLKMPRVVREVGLEIAANELDATALNQRRAEWVVDLASPAETELRGKNQSIWLQRLDLEREHINLAIQHLVASGSVQAVELTGALWSYWHLRGLYNQGTEGMTAALSVPQANTAPRYGRCLRGRAVLHYLAGRVDPAIADAEAALPILVANEDHDALGFVYSLLGMIDMYRGRLGASERWYRTGLTSGAAETSERTYAALQGNLGELLGHQGRFDEAIDLLDEATARFEREGDERSAADCATMIAGWNLARGAPHTARETLEATLPVLAQLSDSQLEADARLKLAEAALLLDDLGTADEELTTVTLILTEVEDPWGLALLGAHRAMLHFLRGETTFAHRAANRSLLDAKALNYDQATCRAALVSALCKLEASDPTRASRAVADGLRAVGGNPILLAALCLTASAVAIRGRRGSVRFAHDLAADALVELDPVAAWKLPDMALRLAPSAAAAEPRTSSRARDNVDLQARALELLDT